MKNLAFIAFAFASLFAAAPAPAMADDARAALQSPRGTAPFAPEVYAERRRALMERLGPGVTMLKAASYVVGEKQDADFAYLTGITDEANAIVLLSLTEDGEYREYLFLAPYTPEADVWEGERLSQGEEIRQRTGFERIGRTNQLEPRVLTVLAARTGTLHYLGPLATTSQPVPWALDMMQKTAARIPGVKIANAYDALPAMRAAKEPREIELMKGAVAATSKAHRNAMAAVRPGMTEYDLQAIIERTFREEGAMGLAFDSIVGSGHNAAILHYIRNDRRMEDGDVVLIDIGAEYQYYASDITRTFPVNGRFTERQREVYDIVMEAQTAAAAMLRPGVRLREEVQDAALDVLRQHGLRDAFPHSIGHFVGLRVHDAGNYEDGLPVGAVVTIEPGVYLPEEGFGVRIEDVYVITRRGAERLTTDIPHTADEIEAFMAEARASAAR